VKKHAYTSLFNFYKHD